MAARKKREAHKIEKPASKVADVKSDLANAKDPFVVSNAVMDAANGAKVAGEASEDPKKNLAGSPAETVGTPSAVSPDPLAAFEEKIEPVVADAVIKPAEQIATTEGVSPQPGPSDALADFKEKMKESEKMPAFSAKPQKNFMWPILFVFVAAILILGGIFVYKQGIGTNKETGVNVVTLSPTPTAIPQPSPVVDLTKYEIKVLNGSEVEGEAGRQRTNLEGEGFVVSGVGNADDSDYTKTIIQAKKEVEAGFLDKLKSALEKSFIVAETEKLSEDSDDDVIVILGSQTN